MDSGVPINDVAAGAVSGATAGAVPVGGVATGAISSAASWFVIEAAIGALTKSAESCADERMRRAKRARRRASSVVSWNRSVEGETSSNPKQISDFRFLFKKNCCLPQLSYPWFCQGRMHFLHHGSNIGFVT